MTDGEIKKIFAEETLQYIVSRSPSAHSLSATKNRINNEFSQPSEHPSI